MKKGIVKSWGNIFRKDVLFVDDTENNKSYLSIGNQNSYGDAPIPKDKYILKYNESNNVSTSVFDYQTKNMIILFGVPGKSNVTIGGAIAADTHGKDNHWGGSFSKNVKKIKLATKKGFITADREKNFDVFQTTLGGYGLTGSIVDVELFENNLEITNLYNTEVKTGIGIDSLLSICNTIFGEYWFGWVNFLGRELSTRKLIRILKKNKIPRKNLIKGIKSGTEKLNNTSKNSNVAESDREYCSIMIKNLENKIPKDLFYRFKDVVNKYQEIYPFFKFRF